MKTNLGLCGMVALFLAVQAFAQAGQPPAEPGGREGGHAGMRPPRGGGPEQGMPSDPVMEQGMLGRFLQNPKVAEKLGLTPEQVTTLKEQSEPLRAEMESLRKALEQASMEQAKLLTGDKVSEEALMAAVEKTAAVRLKMAKLAMRQLLLVKKTLTLEQVSKAREMMREHRSRRFGEPGPKEGAGPFQRRLQERKGGAPMRHKQGPTPEE